MGDIVNDMVNWLRTAPEPEWTAEKLRKAANSIEQLTTLVDFILASRGRCQHGDCPFHADLKLPGVE